MVTQVLTASPSTDKPLDQNRLNPKPARPHHLHSSTTFYTILSFPATQQSLLSSTRVPDPHVIHARSPTQKSISPRRASPSLSFSAFLPRSSGSESTCPGCPTPLLPILIPVPPFSVPLRVRIDGEFLERRTAHDSRAPPQKRRNREASSQPCLALLRGERRLAEEDGVMYPVVAGTPPAAAARLPAASRVDKATSHLLQAPDWAINLEICDALNADRWQTKDVVKAVKKRLQHKDPKVQFFTLTLLETMMKNCGEYVHFEVVDQHVLQEMVKIVQKRHDMQVRDKALLLLDSWQEAFGGPGGKYPQYYWSYIELKRAGVMFPRRPVDAPPVFTPPATHQAYGSPRYPSGSLNERITSDTGTLSLDGLNNIRNATELLCDMVNALDPADRMSVKDEIITDLVNQCRSNQQKLMQFVSSTGDEELLKQGLELNDRLQSVLTKHDAIASGSPLPVETPSRELHREDPNPAPSTPITHENKAQVDEDEDDEFAQIARRKNKSVICSDEASSSAVDQALVPVDPELSEVSSVASNAIVPLDATSVSGTRTKEQDMIDLLSLTLYSPPESSADSSTQNQNGSQPSVTSNGPETLPSFQPAVANEANYPANNQAYPTNQGYVPYNNYVAPWAQTGPVAQPAPYPTQPQQYVSSYPAPPWSMPASANSFNPFQPVTYQTPNTPAASVTPSAAYPTTSTPYAAPSMQHAPSPAPKPVQSYTSSISQTYNGPNMATNALMNGNQRPKETPVAAARPYYMPDNLFGDLIDVKSFGAGSKITRSTSMPSPKGGGQPMIGRNK